ncbi:MAG: EAL domain-containing protein [Epsilonproteobacteria bacterium]|nr:EAL domain-containing protein [Campylobacterota bacterium]
MNFLDIFENHPYIAILIYTDKILYANKAFEMKTGYSLEELKHLSPLELFPEDFPLKDKIKNILQKRLSGENFPAEYEYIEVKNAYKKRIYVKFITQTIEFNGSYAGMAVGIDVTNEIKKDYLLRILKEINSNIISNDTISELYPQIINIFTKNNRYSYATVLLNENGNLKAKYRSSSNAAFIEKIDELINNCKGIQKLKNNELFIINDIENSSIHLKELFLKNGFYSLSCIPIFKDESLEAVIGICSKYKHDFEDEEISILKEAKEDIEYALKKEEHLSYLKILQEGLDKTFSWVIITDEEANILYANKSVEEISGYKKEEIIGKKPNIFKSGYHPPEFYKAMWQKLKNNEVVETILVNKRKDGSLFYLKDRIVPITTPDGKKYYISLGIDITTETILAQQLSKDPLTELDNRSEFLKKADKKIENEKNYALILIDIKDFKIFNQLNGTEAGDFILKKFAQFLQTVFDESDLIARIGADEFAVFLEFNSLHELHMTIQKLIEKLKNYKIFNQIVPVNIGITVFPEDSKNIFDLLEKAAIALAIAKEKGDYTYEFFSKEINDKIIEYSDIKHLLQTAIINKEFVYYFQPYVDSNTFKAVGAETLIRIKQGDKIIMPNYFIDYAENSGYIKEIEKIMFPQFLKHLAKLDIPLSFNISGKSLTDKDHIKFLFDNIEDLPITIELTEREIAFNVEYTKEIIEYFKSKKFKIAIDDFGTGYSSLTYLKNLPVDYIKIDMSFIKNIQNSQKDRAVVETIIDFAHKFELKTIAEGVENKEQIKILQELKCDYLQGFYFAKPMPYEEFEEYIKKHSS